MRRLSTLTALAAAIGAVACGSADNESSPVVRQIGMSGVTSSQACGEQDLMDVADLAAATNARVVGARLVDASPGLRSVDFAGYVRPALPEGGQTTNFDGANSILSGELPAAPPAVRLPDGLSISRDDRHPTTLVLIVDTNCSAAVRAGREQAELSAHEVEITVESGGRESKQTLTTDLSLCVSKTAPETCP